MCATSGPRCATLAARGVRIALDDFGTGYNSLARLADLPVHILKIDRTFVHDSQQPPRRRGAAGGARGGAAHGLEVVAEGVERAEELHALVSMGVGTVQGYMLGRPGTDAADQRDDGRAPVRSRPWRHLTAAAAHISSVGLSSRSRPSRPLTKAGESSVDSARASSTASSTATASGTSSL